MFNDNGKENGLKEKDNTSNNDKEDEDEELTNLCICGQHENTIFDWVSY